MFSLVGFHGSNLMAAYFRAYGEEPMAKVNIYMMLGVLFTAGLLIKKGIFLGAIFILAGGASILLTKTLQYRLKVISGN
jgi:hypothetical protein